VPYSWYVFFYVLALLVLPLIGRLLNGNRWFALAVAFGPFLLVYLILALTAQSWMHYDITVRCVHMMICMLFGYVMARHSFFTYIAAVVKRRWLLNLISAVLFLGLLPVYILTFLGVLYCFLLIPLVFLLNALTSHHLVVWINVPLRFVGKESMMYWFLHGFFVAQYVNSVFPASALVSWAYSAIAITLVVILFISPFAYGFSWVQKIINGVIDKIFRPRR